MKGTQSAVIEIAAGVQLPLEVVTSTIAILANRGGGKSALAHLLVERMYEAGLPIAVVDVKGDWWGIRSSADGKGPGLPFVIFGGDHGDVPLESTAGELLADLIVDDRIPAVLDLSDMSKTAQRQFATAFAERLYRRNRDPLMVVIEEADVLIPQRVSADNARLIGAMEDLAKRGRSRGIGMLTVSQRPQEAAKAVLDLMETVVLLRMTGPRSIKAVREWISVNSDQDDEDVRDIIGSLPSLAVGEGWVWSPGFLWLCKRAQFPLFSTFDSHATPAPGRIRVVPKARAEIDLDRLGAEIAATRERARESDPSALRAEAKGLRNTLEDAQAQMGAATAAEAQLRQQLVERDADIAALRRRVAELEAGANTPEAVEALSAASELISTALSALMPCRGEGFTDGEAGASARASRAGPEVGRVPPIAAERAGGRRRPTTIDAGSQKFRKGAHRMIEALARMDPLRLTKAQWSTVAGIRHTGGTWSTYLGELRRAGFLDETSAGFRLAEAGWDYLGVRPEPMSAAELQQHYLSILRAGASRMLRACVDAYPEGLTKQRLAELAEVASSGGTFSTYLGELRRNGLVEQRGNRVIATEILMYGAEAQR
ncbi:helicase HerA domain-containing protein [Mycobacterium sp. smrl_JER01]|uniref:helicase HerA domain-containing protein n=1 Tax=Mycobacterium sp. smrl_JER01 TaxID=3402633 RepID=UPI003AC2676B